MNVDIKQYLPTMRAALEGDTLNWDSMYLGIKVAIPLTNIALKWIQDNNVI